MMVKSPIAERAALLAESCGSVGQWQCHIVETSVELIFKCDTLHATDQCHTVKA